MAENADIRELSQPRTLSEAVLKRTSSTVSPGHRDAVAQVNSKQAADIAASHTVTNEFTVPTEQVPQLDMLKITIERTIDGEKSTGVVVRNTEQIRRLNQANAAAELAVAVVDKGYDHLTTGQKRQVQERVLPAMMRYWPALNVALGPMNRQERQQAMSDILSDPQFHQELRIIVLQLQADETTRQSVDKTTYEHKKEEYEQKNQQLHSIRRDYADAAAHNHTFDSGQPNDVLLGGPPQGIPHVADLEAAKSTAERQERLLTAEHTGVKSKIQEHERWEHHANPKSDADIAAKVRLANSELGGLRTRRTDLEQTVLPRKEQEKGLFDAQIRRRQELEAEREQARSRERELLNQRDVFEHEVNTLQSEMLSAQADLGINKLEKAAKEEGFVKDLQGSFARAAEAVVRKRALEVEKARDDLLKKYPDKAKGKGLRNRWVNLDGEINKDRVKADYNRLIRSDFNDVVADMLVEQGGMRRDEAKHKLASDDTFAKEARTEAATELMTRFIQSGGKLKSGEVRRLYESEIGIEMVGNAMNNNEAFKTKLKELMPEEKSTDWKAVLKKIKLPAPTWRQLIIGAAVVGTGFFAGPTLLGLLIPQVEHALGRWEGFAHKYPGVGEAGRTAIENVQAASSSVAEHISNATPLDPTPVLPTP